MAEGRCHCGKVHWRFDGTPEAATVCNCTICRRYGALWAYDYDGRRIHHSGATSVYVRRGGTIGFHFCADCGCVSWWRALEPGENGLFRIAVNLRLAEPDAVAAVPLMRFDGLGRFEDLPPDGRCVADMVF